MKEATIVDDFITSYVATSRNEQERIDLDHIGMTTHEIMDSIVQDGINPNLPKEQYFGLIHEQEEHNTKLDTIKKERKQLLRTLAEDKNVFAEMYEGLSEEQKKMLLGAITQRIMFFNRRIPNITQLKIDAYEKFKAVRNSEEDEKYRDIMSQYSNERKDIMDVAKHYSVVEKYVGQQLYGQDFKPTAFSEELSKYYEDNWYFEEVEPQSNPNYAVMEGLAEFETSISSMMMPGRLHHSLGEVVRAKEKNQEERSI